MRAGVWRTVVAAVMVAGLAGGLTGGCGIGDDEEGTMPERAYTITEAVENVDAVLADIRTVMENELGTEGWERQAEPFVDSCGSGPTSRYWAGGRVIHTAVPPERWPAFWERILAAVAPHGYTESSGDPAPGDSHFIRLYNSRGDTITVSTTQPDATGYRAESACAAGRIELPEGHDW